MKNRDRILSVLQRAAGPLCDDCLAKEANLRQRQTAYSKCEGLKALGRITRYVGVCSICAKSKKVSRVEPSDPGTAQQVMDATVSETPPPPVAAPLQAHSVLDQSEPGDRPWYWEGNVQSCVIAHLVRQGYAIRSVADTASRAAGKDIVAIGPDGQELWVSVKGYPENSANTQARHWFSGAIFDLILYRGENPDARLAVAFPHGYKTYANLAARVEWLQREMGFAIYWVEESGSVRKQLVQCT